MYRGRHPQQGMIGLNRVKTSMLPKEAHLYCSDRRSFQADMYWYILVQCLVFICTPYGVLQIHAGMKSIWTLGQLGGLAL